MFNVCCEGISRQVNYLIDKASDTGKSANTVVSLLHHFLENHGVREVKLQIHADYCTGQNKCPPGKLGIHITSTCGAWIFCNMHTCTYVQCEVLLILTILFLTLLGIEKSDRLHRTITMSFMLVGHTKFSPDWCFGLFKQRYRCTFVSCLEDVVDVVNSSADVNVAQLVGTQSGEPVVPVYNWAAFLGEHVVLYHT